MNKRHIWLVFTKEFIDILRDRKTWIGAFIIPIVVIPFVMFLLGSSLEGVEQDARSFVPIAVKGDVQSDFVQRLAAAPGVKLVYPSDPKAALQAAEIRAVIILPQQFQQQINRGKTATIEVLYDPSNNKSLYARELIEQTAEEYQKDTVQHRLQSMRLSPETIEPIRTVYQSAATDETMSGSMLAGIVTLMLVVTLASGGIAAATDLVAGEKERGTLESLISAPVSPKSILTAKLLAVMVMCIVSAVASLFSMTIIFSQTPLGVNEKFSLGFFSAASTFVFVVMILLLAAMFSSVLLMISTIAKSFKESQTYMAPVVFAGMVPAYMMMPLHPADIPFVYYFLPVFNGTAIFKEIFFGALVPLHAVYAVCSTVVYVCLCILLASRFFHREGILLK